MKKIKYMLEGLAYNFDLKYQTFIETISCESKKLCITSKRPLEQSLQQMNRLEIIKSHISATIEDKKLKGKTVVITGASRGIGLAIGLRCAKDGANVAILAKTVSPHPKLPGTIFSAAEQVTKAGGRALPLQCDIRYQDQVKNSIQKVVETFGGIDILVNNASALDWKGTLQQQMKKFDLMHQIIVKGTFMASKYCLPHLIKSQGHILNSCVPPGHYTLKSMSERVAYSVMKESITIMTMAMAEEFKNKGVKVNGLWPKKTIGTAAIHNLLGGQEVLKRSRKPEIMGDAAYLIFTKKGTKTGKFYFDQELLEEDGQQQFEKYKYYSQTKETQ